MTNIRPQIATQLCDSPPIDRSQLIVPLSQAWQRNGIIAYADIPIIRMGGQHNDSGRPSGASDNSGDIFVYPDKKKKAGR